MTAQGKTRTARLLNRVEEWDSKIETEFLYEIGTAASAQKATPETDTFRMEQKAKRINYRIRRGPYSTLEQP